MHYVTFARRHPNRLCISSYSRQALPENPQSTPRTTQTLASSCLMTLVLQVSQRKLSPLHGRHGSHCWLANSSPHSCRDSSAEYVFCKGIPGKKLSQSLTSWYVLRPWSGPPCTCEGNGELCQGVKSLTQSGKYSTGPFFVFISIWHASTKDYLGCQGAKLHSWMYHSSGT